MMLLCRVLTVLLLAALWMTAPVNAHHRTWHDAGGPKPTPTSTPTPAPTATPTSPTGWTLIWNDPFDVWDDNRYNVYSDPEDGNCCHWDDTSNNGIYTPSIISASGGLLRINIKTVNGVHQVAAFVPQLNGALWGNVSNMIYEFRIRADSMAGYKGVPLLWPASNVWPRDGEINWPEGSFNGPIHGYMHRQSATSGGDQDVYSAPVGTTWQDWHTYRLEWINGVSAKFYIDGVLIGHSTNRVPNTPMHLVMQFETNITTTEPSDSVSGYVYIDYLKMWTH